MRLDLFKRLFWVSCWALLAFFSVYVDAQTANTTAICPGGIPQTAVEEDFVALTGAAEGEVLHQPSNLVFMRCSLGQTWDGSTCVGEAETFLWSEALAVSRGFEFNQQNTWRLPNIKELNMITERACVRPSINEAIFPQTPPDDFWTSTPSIDDPLRAWSTAFSNGTMSIRAKERGLFVRLVRVNQS